MSLVELAKKEWERKKKEIEEKKWKETLRFVEDVKKAFKEKFHVEPDRVVPQSPSKAVIECDGLKFVAEEKHFSLKTVIDFHLVKTCSKCGKEAYDEYSSIINLADLGRQLEEEFVCEECKGSTASRTHAEEIRDLLEELLIKLGVRFEE